MADPGAARMAISPAALPTSVLSTTETSAPGTGRAPETETFLPRRARLYLEMAVKGGHCMDNRVAELFHQLADLSAAERTRYLAEHRIGSEIREEVEELLGFD